MTDRRSSATGRESRTTRGTASTPDRKASATDRRASATRRGFLALAGSAALAGCNAISDVTEDEPPTIDGEEFRDALSAEPPSVAETVPVEIEASRLDESADRARRLLSSVPAPFDREEIPNGAIRAELARLYEDATAELDDVADAPTAAEEMARLRDARASAREVAAAWEAVDEGLARTDVLGTVPAVRDGIDAFRRRWRYVGDDPVRAVLVHGEIEALVAFAFNATGSAIERHRREPGTPLAVGELAGRIEEARAALADAEYLFDGYAESLAEPRDVRDGLEAAGDRLVATLDDRRASLPDGEPDDASSLVDRDVEGTPVASALTDLYRGFDYADGLDDERATGRRASAILSVHETLVRVRAFEALRERVANDEHVTVETADDVRAVREGAFEAVEAALDAGDHPALDRYVLAQIASDFEYLEERLRNRANDDEVPASWLDRDLGHYVLVGSMARATPPTSAEVADAIRRTI